MPIDLLQREASLHTLDQLAKSGALRINVYGLPGVGKSALVETWIRTRVNEPVHVEDESNSEAAPVREATFTIVVRRQRDEQCDAWYEVQPLADDEQGMAARIALVLSRVERAHRAQLQHEHDREITALAERSEGLPAVCVALGEQLRLLAPAEALRRFDELGAGHLLPTGQFWGGFRSIEPHLRDALLVLTAFPAPFTPEAARVVLEHALEFDREHASAKLDALRTARFVVKARDGKRLTLVPTVRFDETVAGSALFAAARRTHALHYLSTARDDIDDTRWSNVLAEERAHLRRALWHAASDPLTAEQATHAQADRNTLVLALPPDEQSRWARSVRHLMENEGHEATAVHALLNEELVLRHGGHYQDASALLAEAERRIAERPNAWTEARALRARLAHVRRPGGELAFLLGKTTQVAERARDKPIALSQMLPVAAWCELLVADDPEAALTRLDMLDALQGPTIISRLARSTVLLEAQRYDETRTLAQQVANEGHPALRTFHLRMNRVLADIFEGVDRREQLDALCVEAQQRQMPIEGWIRIVRATLPSKTQAQRLEDLRGTFKSSGVSDPVPVTRAACLRLVQPESPPLELLAASAQRGVARRWCAAMGRAANDPERQRFLLRLALEPLGIRTNGEPHTRSLMERSSAVRLVSAISEQSPGDLPEAWTTTFATDNLRETQRRAIDCLRLAWALEPGLGLEVPPLFEWTWMEPVHDLETAANRTRVLIAKLRREGWRERLPTTKSGYFLSETG